VGSVRVERYAGRMSETLFSKIIRGEIPCFKVYEDEFVFSFLDIAPLSAGHTLVIPKRPARTLDELDAESAAALGRALVLVARAVKQVTGCAAYNILQNNEAAAHQAVFHVHFHIIPKPNEQQGLGVGWPASRLDLVGASALAEQLRVALQGSP
jgi:histidine triad (HIT) family protein